MHPVAYVSHHIPGRIRIKLTEGKNNPPLLERVRELALAVAGVAAAEFNPLTGSILIHYAPAERYEFEELLRSGISTAVSLILEPHGSSEKRSPGARSRKLRSRPRISKAAQSMLEFFNQVDDTIRATTDDELDLRMLLPLAVASAGLFAFPRAISTPLGLTLMIFAFNSFNTLHAGEEAEAFESVGNGMMA